MHAWDVETHNDMAEPTRQNAAAKYLRRKHQKNAALCLITKSMSILWIVGIHVGE